MKLSCFGLTFSIVLYFLFRGEKEKQYQVFYIYLETTTQINCNLYFDSFRNLSIHNVDIYLGHD